MDAYRSASAGGAPDREIAHHEDDVSPLAAWCSVAILLLFSLVSVIDRQIIALLVEPIKADLGLSDTQLGLLQGIAFALFYSTAGIPIGWAVDRFSRRKIIYLSITLWSLSAASCGLARNFWSLFLGRTLVGVGEGALTPTAVSLISDLFPRHKVGTAMGVYAAGLYLGMGLSLTIGGFVVGLFAGQPSVHIPFVGDIKPWQAVFLTTGLPGVVIALLAFLLKDPRARRGASSRAGAQGPGLGGYLRSDWRVVAHCFGAFGLAATVTYGIGAWTPAYLARSFALRAEDIGLTWGLVAAVSGTFGAISGGLLIDRVYRAGHRDACVLVPAICSMLCLPFVAGAYFMPTPTGAIACLGIGMAIFGAVAAGSYATWQRIAPPGLRGQVAASFTLVAGLLGVGAGPIAVALITDMVLRDEALVGVSVAILAALIMPVVALLLLTGRGLVRDCVGAPQGLER